MNRPLAYWFSGGEVVARGGRVLDPGDVGALRAWHEDELRAAITANDLAVQAHASRLANDLELATREAERWRRAAGLEIIFP